uniref:PARP catalytic domain-containing protein n=2 Tax=Anguilla anguilla TaxID=7936 RepID=A0A0E9XNL1_ANGAN
MLGRGVYVSRDPEKARRYPLDLDPAGRRIMELKVDVGKVKKIDQQGHPLQKTWQTKGYDTAWVPPKCGMVASGLSEDCIRDPSRIKVTKVLKPTSLPPSQMP